MSTPASPDPRRRPRGLTSPIAAALGSPTSAISSDAADHSTERLAAVAHELANLLDGSMRWLSLAQSQLAQGAPAASEQSLGKRLDHVAASMQRMAALIDTLMRRDAGSLARHFGASHSMLEAVEHAVGALRPLAEERGVAIALRADPALAEIGAGPLYPVVSNGLRNAVEATAKGGVVHFHARLLPTLDGDAEVGFDIVDDGGETTGLFGEAMFEFGFSTKEHGSGIGLALARDIVHGMGGSITLTPRNDTDHNKGAHFRVRCPAPRTIHPA